MRRDGRKTVHALTVLVLTIAPACALTPPAQSSGQVESHDGVALTIVGQACSQTTDPSEEQASWYLVEQRLAVEVQNGSPDPVTIHRDRFRLALQDGSDLHTVTWGAADPVTVEGGGKHVFKLRFMANSEVTCESAMRLDAGGVITQRQHEVALTSISFVPRRPL